MAESLRSNGDIGIAMAQEALPTGSMLTDGNDALQEDLSNSVYDIEPEDVRRSPAKMRRWAAMAMASFSIAGGPAVRIASAHEQAPMETGKVAAYKPHMYPLYNKEFDKQLAAKNKACSSTSPLVINSELRQKGPVPKARTNAGGILRMAFLSPDGLKKYNWNEVTQNDRKQFTWTYRKGKGFCYGYVVTSDGHQYFLKPSSNTKKGGKYTDPYPTSSELRVLMLSLAFKDKKLTAKVK